MTPSINIKNCDIGYGNKVILSNINLSLSPGRVHLIVGSNGEGKTSLLKTIAGGIAPVSGVVSNVNARDVSYLSTEFNFSDYQINGNEYIELIASFNSFSANILNAEIELIDNSISSSMLELSSGMRQILRIKALSLENKNIYLWDEPFKSLAPEIKKTLVKFLHSISTRKIIVVTDHTIDNWLDYNPIVYKISEGAIVKLE